MLKELGSYKQKIMSILSRSDDIKELLFGEGSSIPAGSTEEMLEKHILPYHYVDETLTEPGSYLFVEVTVPTVGTNTKLCRIVIEILVHRSLFRCSKPGYSGNRADVLAQVAEELLLGSKEQSRAFGIGRLALDEAGIISSKQYCGRTLTFTVPNFR